MDQVKYNCRMKVNFLNDHVDGLFHLFKYIAIYMQYQAQDRCSSQKLKRKKIGSCKLKCHRNGKCTLYKYVVSTNLIILF